MDDQIKSKEHRVVLEDRKRLSVTGVQKVQSFGQKEIVLETIQGMLSIKGGGLDIKHLDLQGGLVEIEGTIVEAMFYSHNSKEARQNLLGKIFR